MEGCARPDCQARLAVLANPLRLRLVRLLVRHLPHPLPAGEIAAALAVPRSTLSAHLAALCEAGLLVQRVRGPLRLYHVVPAALGQLLDWLAADVGLGRAGAMSSSCGAAIADSEHSGRRLRLLFLCRDGASLSPLAAAFAQRWLWGRAVCFAAGVHPAARPDPVLEAVLCAQGMPQITMSPQPVRALPAAHVVIALDTEAAEALPGAARLPPPVCAFWPLPVGSPGGSDFGPGLGAESGTERRVLPRAMGLDAAMRSLAPRLSGLARMAPERLPRGALQAALDTLSSGLPEVCRAAASAPPPRRRWSSPAPRASAAS